MGLRKISATMMTALGVVLAAVPAAGQQAAPTTNQATPTPTPGTIGNPALENFNLNGTVTREATPPARTPTPAPTRTPTPAPAPTPSPAPTAREAAPTPAPDAPRSSAPAPRRNVAPSPVATVPTPSAEVAPTLPDPVTTAPAPDLMPPAPAPGGSSPWPWLVAVALALAAGAAWWIRRQRGEGEALAYAALDAPAAEPVPAPTARPGAPAVPAPLPDDGITSRVGSGAIGSDGGIVSRAFQPRLAFDLEPLKFETDGEGNARLTFELVVVNIGSAPARDIRVEAKLFNAGPDQDRQIGQFFKAPGAMGSTLPPIAPRERMPLRSRIGLPAGEYQALEMGGRSLVVPMLAVNAVYRGSGGETQESASWLVGAAKAGEDVEKLKPFPLDRPIAATALGARIHSMGLQNQA